MGKKGGRKDFTFSAFLSESPINWTGKGYRGKGGIKELPACLFLRGSSTGKRRLSEGGGLGTGRGESYE